MGTNRSFEVLAFQPATYARYLRLRDHAVLFHDTDDVKRKICFPFLEAGPLKGEAVVYLVSEHKLDSESREIKRYGISVDSPRKKAFEIMSANEWYLKKGKFQAETIIANWVKLLKEKLDLQRYVPLPKWRFSLTMKRAGSY